MQSIPASKTPMAVQTVRWILDPVGYLTAHFKRYGDIFKANFYAGTPEPILMLSEPTALQYLLTHDSGKEFSAPGEVNLLLEPLLGRQNLIMSSGNQHRNRRQLVMPPFHGERLQAFSQTIQQVAQTVVAKWPANSTLDVRSAMQKMTMQVILQVVFGLHEGDRYEQLERLLSIRLNMTNSPFNSALIFFPALQQDFGAWSPGARIRKLAQQTDERLFAEIQERRENPDPNRTDILSMLLAAKDEDGNGLDNQDLRDELMTLLVAGHETTATALTWAMYWIHSQPEVKQKLLAELEAVQNPSDPSSFLQLPYLSAVCNETLRINPVGMLTFPRQVEMPVELCGYPLRPGMLVMGCIYLLHHREDLYPQSEQFKPERFLERQFTPYEFMPFGGGVRRCIGSALALYEMKIVLGTILTQVDLALVNKAPVRPQRRGLTLGQNTSVQVQKLRVKEVNRKQPLHV